MAHGHEHPSSIEKHTERLRNAGYKLTNARLTILQVIEAHGGHVTSAQVLDGVTEADDSIGRASVFRTLDLLTRLGIVRPTYVGNSQTPDYILMPDGHHHHIICTHCNRIVEFEDCDLEPMARELEQRFNMRIDGHLLEFYGLCADCKDSESEE